MLLFIAAVLMICLGIKPLRALMGYLLIGAIVLALIAFAPFIFIPLLVLAAIAAFLNSRKVA